MRSTSFMLLAGLAKLSSAIYVLEDDYQPNKFLDKFDFFSDSDPTEAYVTYLDRSSAEKEGLAAVRENAVYLGVDHKNVASGSGRKTVRIESKKDYDHGLIIADIAHMPGGECGTWPAFWTSGPSWPEDGELDIIEGVNRQKQNDYALHTKKGCSIEKTGNFTGTVMTPDCDVFAEGQADNQGCLFEGPKTASYGPEFNKNGGGVYAVDWTSDGITIWFFPRGSVPQNIKDGKPDPSTWGVPDSAFEGGCDFDKFVMKQRIVFNTAFCGGWAEGKWDSDSVCAAKGSCRDYVKNNPKDFEETFWSINYMQVYQQRAKSEQPSAPPSISSPAGTTKAPPATTQLPTPTGNNSKPQGTPSSVPSAPADGPADKPSVSNPPANPEPANCTPKPTTCRTYTTHTTIPIVKTASP